MPALRRLDPTAAAQCRARPDLDLPAHAVAAGRLQLQASADLLGLWRRSDRTLRTVGRRMDDAGSDPALPALGHVRHRQRAARTTAGRALVSAVALRALARRQRDVAVRAARHAFVAAPLSIQTRIAAPRGTRSSRRALI